MDVHSMQFPAFDASGAPGDSKGIDLVYNIPLQVTVELGRTKKEINEILKFNAGTVVVLDKIAGEQLNADYYIDYLAKKFTEVYEL